MRRDIYREVTSLRRTAANSSGIMLIDLLLATAIVGIAAVAILEILTASAQAGRRTEMSQIAVNLCRERLEQIRTISSVLPGTGSNSGDPFLPDLSDVSVQEYSPGFYLTQSDTYQASDGTPGSLSALNPPVRVDRITQIEWVDDGAGGTTQDYYKVTVTVFWNAGGATQSLSLETILGAN